MMKQQSNKTYFAEIISSNISTWQAQTWQWDIMPEFGSLVTVIDNGRTIFGIVYDISTSPIDAIRQPIPYKMTQEELLQNQPQIFQFLKTSFSCIALGYKEQHDTIYYNLPPQPPKMHTFVGYATRQELELFFKNQQYLYILCNGTENLNTNELLLAIIKHQMSNKILTKELFNTLIQTFFRLNKNNYLQTKLFLSRVSDLTSSMNW